MPPKLTDGKVIWRSKRLPQLFATDFMIEVFNERFPVLKGKMKKEFEQMELWLLAHPARQPKRNWAAFASRWMKRAAEYRMNPSRPGVARGRTPGGEGFSTRNAGEPISLDEFLGKLAHAQEKLHGT
jgi:hypothetical protein